MYTMCIYYTPKKKTRRGPPESGGQLAAQRKWAPVKRDTSENSLEKYHIELMCGRLNYETYNRSNRIIVRYSHYDCTILYNTYAHDISGYEASIRSYRGPFGRGILAFAPVNYACAYTKLYIYSL